MSNDVVTAGEPTEGMACWKLEAKSSADGYVFAGKVTEVVDSGAYVANTDGNSVLRLYERSMTGPYPPAVGDYWVIDHLSRYQWILSRDDFESSYKPL
jgi:hypothetical protein